MEEKGERTQIMVKNNDKIQELREGRTGKLVKVG